MITSFLSKAVDAPDSEAIARAITLLKDLVMILNKDIDTQEHIVLVMRNDAKVCRKLYVINFLCYLRMV